MSDERTPGSLGPVRIVIADDHPIWRSGIRADLGENFSIVGEAGDATEAIEVIRETRPDLVLSDLNMPGGGGVAVVRACADQTRIVILTVSEAERDLLDAVAAGAIGYLVKSTPMDELRRALWRAAQGEPVFSPSLAALVLGEFRRITRESSPAAPLSDRERAGHRQRSAPRPNSAGLKPWFIPPRPKTGMPVLNRTGKWRALYLSGGSTVAGSPGLGSQGRWGPKAKLPLSAALDHPEEAPLS